MKKIITVIFMAMLSFNANALQYDKVDMVGMTFSYDGLFKDPVTKFNGLLVPLNETPQGVNSFDGTGGVVTFLLLAAVIAVVSSEDDETCSGYKTVITHEPRIVTLHDDSTTTVQRCAD